MILYMSWQVTVLLTLALFFRFKFTLDGSIPVSLLESAEKKRKKRITHPFGH